MAALRGFGADRSDRSLYGNRVSMACTRILPASGAAVVVAMPQNRWEIIGADGADALWLADAEAATGEGPGPDCHRSGAPVRVPDFSAALTARRWPLLAQWDGAAPTTPICSIPLRLGAIRIGFLDLLDAERVLAESHTLIEALAVADAITTLLLSAPSLNGSLHDVDVDLWWRPPLSTRQIHQATGMVSVQLDISAAAAYVRLVGHAFSAARRLDAVASDVVARRLRFFPDADPDTEVGGPRPVRGVQG